MNKIAIWGSYLYEDKDKENGKCFVVDVIEFSFFGE